MFLVDHSSSAIVLAKAVDIRAGEIAVAVQELTAAAKRAQARGSFFVSIALEGDALDAMQRHELAALVKNADPVLKQRLILSIIIVDNALKRGALTALLWLVGPTPKTQACRDIAAALKLARAALVLRGVDFPETCTEETIVAFNLRQG